MGAGKAEGQSSKQASHEATPPLPGASPFPQLLRRVKAQLSRMRCALKVRACTRSEGLQVRTTLDNPAQGQRGLAAPVRFSQGASVSHHHKCSVYLGLPGT